MRQLPTPNGPTPKHRGFWRQGFLLAAVLAACVSAGAREATLVDAVKSGDAAAVRVLLDQKADANSADPDGTTAVHWAVHRNDVAALDLLIRHGGNVSARNRYGVTPIFLAATNGNTVVLTRLLDAGADPNTAMPDGETTLMTAARTGDADAVIALVSRGANVNVAEPAKGQTALMWAAAENNAAVIKALIDRGADLRMRSKGSFTPFLFAVRGGHLEATRTLLDAGADVRESLPDGTSALVLSVMNAHYELASLLLDRGADPNADAQGWTALHQIAWSRRHNAGFNLPGPVQTGNMDSLELARRLAQRGANLNARVKKEPRDGNRNMLNRIGSTPFVMAAKSADVPYMKTLLELGANPALTTDRGTTALMVAAGVGIWAPGENPGTHEEALAAATLALEVGGGGVNDIDKDGETALHGAVYRGGAIPVIKLLIDKGTALEVKNKKGWTPLIVAEGVEYTPNVLKRYPEAAALIREAIAARAAAGRAGRADEVPPTRREDVRRAGLVAEAPQPRRDDAPRARQTESAGVPAVSSRTVWDGVFTDAQAARGEEGYRQSCAMCHKEDLLGDNAAPPLAGAAFTDRWTGSNVDDMVQTILRTMPIQAPSSLSRRAYVEIVSYLLKTNGNPAGAVDLPDDREALKLILITPAR